MAEEHHDVTFGERLRPAAAASQALRVLSALKSRRCVPWIDALSFLAMLGRGTDDAFVVSRVLCAAESADAGASLTYPQQAGTIRKNAFIVSLQRSEPAS